MAEKKKFFETKVGAFLKEKAPGILKTVCDVADDYFPPVKILTAMFASDPEAKPEDKIEFQKLLQEYEITELKAYLADVADARAMNVAIQTTTTSSKIAKLAPYIIAFVVIASTLLLLALLYFKQIPEANSAIAYTTFGAFVSLSGTIINFFFGTSKSSSEKTEFIQNQIKK